MDLPDEARSECEEGIRRWSQRAFHQQHVDFSYAMTQINLYVGDGAAAFARVSGVWPQLEKSFTLRLDVARIVNLELRGRAAIAAAAAAAGTQRATLVGEAQWAIAPSTRSARRGRGRARGCCARRWRTSAGTTRRQASSSPRPPRATRSTTCACTRRWRAAGAARSSAAKRGAPIAQACATWMSAQAVANPEKFMRVLAPGW